MLHGCAIFFPPKMNKENELFLDHLKASYENGQRAIHFVDTKNAFITGLSTVILAFPVWLPSAFETVSSQSLRDFLASVPPLGLSIILLMSFSSAALAVLCLWSAISSVTARKPDPDIRPTVLFPFQSPPKWTFRRIIPWFQKEKAAPESDFEKAWTGLRSGSTTEPIIDEYRVQIRSIGRILGRKMFLQKMAGRFLRLQIVFLVLFILSLMVALLLAPVATDDGSEDTAGLPPPFHVETVANETTNRTSPSAPLEDVDKPKTPHCSEANPQRKTRPIRDIE